MKAIRQNFYITRLREKSEYKYMHIFEKTIQFVYMLRCYIGKFENLNLGIVV